MSTVLIFGVDGYIGYALALSLLREEVQVIGADNLTRQRLSVELKSPSVLPHHIEALRNSFNSFTFYSIDVGDATALKQLFLNEQVDLVVDCARLYSLVWSLNSLSYTSTCLRSIQNFLNLINVLNELNLQKLPVLVLTDLLTYFPGKVPIFEEGLRIFYDDLEDVLPFPLYVNFPQQVCDVAIQSLIPFCRAYFKQFLIDVRIGLVFGVYPHTPFHRLHVDYLQGNFVNYFCAHGVRQGIVNVTIEGKVPLISLTEVVRFLTSAVKSRKPLQFITHVFTSFVPIEDLIYKIKHIFAEDFGYRLRVGFYKKLTHFEGWPETGFVSRDRLNSQNQSVTISLDEELRTLIEYCFKYKKQITSLPKVAI